MNREIKFRAWATIRKEMIDLKAITPLALAEGILEGGDGLFIPFRKDVVLMQFTGLLDRNGKEIYEGDLLLLCGNKKAYPVSFESGSFIIDNEPLCFDLQAEERQPMRVDPKNFATVIGNIHENPELLK